MKKRTIDIPSTWKFLVLFNILVTAFGFWVLISQNNYIMSVIESNLPVALPAYYKQTAVVVNPFTGNFISVNSFTLGSTIMTVLILLGMHFLLRENL